MASITISKLAWLADNEPEVVAGTDSFMLPHDFLTFRLTGNRVTDRGDASGTGWWSPITESYVPELLGLVVDDPVAFVDRLPTVLGPGARAGRLTAWAASATGLKSGIPVACGTGDNMASAYAMGLEPGDIAMSLGTSGTVFAVSEHAIADSAGTVTGFADASGRYLPLVATLNATRTTDTFARWLGVDQDRFSRLALESAPDSRLVLKPYFDGERTPNLPNARGTLFGLGNDTSRADLAAVAHIGVVCSLLYGVDALRRCGVDTRGTLHLTGGGARSPAFQQWVADLWRRRIAVHTDDETVAAGACRQAVTAATGSEADWVLIEDTVVDPRPAIDGDSIREAFQVVG